MKKNTANTIFRSLAIHVIIWLLVIQLIFDVSGLYESLHALLVEGERWFDEAFLMIPLLIGLFYWNRNWLVPTFLSRQSWWKYLITVFISVIVFQSIGYGLAVLIQNQGYYFEEGIYGFFDFFLYFNLITLTISASLGISQIALNNAAQKKEAQAQQKATELKYLANQFNPHFLYNTLNGLYSKAIEENASATAEAIVRLSEIMRFPINQGLKKEVPLVEEVKFIEDYIALQKLRLGIDYPIHFEKEGNLEGINILPLSLIVLVENSFKFGVSPKKQSPIVFQLQLKDDFLCFTSENQFRMDKQISSHSIGLDNLKTRLGLSYGENFTIQTEQKEHKYFVSLKLKIMELVEGNKN